MLLMKLTPSHFTVVSWLCSWLRTTHCHIYCSHCARWLDSTHHLLGCLDVMASIDIYSHVTFIVAAVRSHEPFRFGGLQSQRASDWLYVWLPLGEPIATFMHTDNTQHYLVWGKRSLFLAWFPWVEWKRRQQSQEQLNYPECSSQKNARKLTFYCIALFLIVTLICQGIPHFSPISPCDFLGIHSQSSFLSLWYEKKPYLPKIILYC